MLARICEQTVAFAKFINEEIQGNDKNSFKVLAKLSSAGIACVFGMVATYMGDSGLLQDMKNTSSNSMWLHMIEGLSRNGGGWYYKRVHQGIFHDNAGPVVLMTMQRELMTMQKEHQIGVLFDRELQIRDFYDNAILLQDLKKRMPWFSHVTEENEAEMKIVIYKLEKKIDKISKTVEDMSTHAQKYSREIREAGITINQLIADRKLQPRVYFSPEENILQLKRFDDIVIEVVSNLFQATGFLPADLYWYTCAREADAELFPDHPVMLKRTSSEIKSILEQTELDPFYGILEVLRCLNLRLIRARAFLVTNKGYKEFKSTRFHPFLYKQYKISHETSRLCEEFINMLNGISESLTILTLALEQILLKGIAGDYAYGELLQHLNDLKAGESVGFSDDFLTSFEYIVKQSAKFIKIKDLMIYRNRRLQTPCFSKHVSLRVYCSKKLKCRKALREFQKVVSLTVLGVFSILATCLGDFELLQEMENMKWNSTLLHLFKCFSRKSDTWYDDAGIGLTTSDDENLRIWDCYGNEIILKELKNKMATFSCLTNKAEEEMMIVIHKLKRKLSLLSSTVTNMSELRWPMIQLNES